MIICRTLYKIFCPLFSGSASHTSTRKQKDQRQTIGLNSHLCQWILYNPVSDFKIFYFEHAYYDMHSLSVMCHWLCANTLDDAHIAEGTPAIENWQANVAGSCKKYSKNENLPHYEVCQKGTFIRFFNKNHSL